MKKTIQAAASQLRSFRVRSFRVRAIVALTLLLAASFFLVAATPSETPSEPLLRTGEEPTVLRGALVEEILLSGEIAARDAVAMVAPNANLWPVQLRFLVEDGTSVRAGDMVAEFDNNQLLLQLDQVKNRLITSENDLLARRAGVASEMASAVYDVEQAQASLEKARLEADLPEGMIADQEYARLRLAQSRAEVALTTAERKLETTRAAAAADLKILEVAMEKTRNEVEQARYHLELLTLYAPRDGIVLLEEDRREGVLYKSGDGMFPGQIFATLPDLATLYVEADLFDVDDGRIALGTELTATLDALPERVYQGRVISVDDVAQIANRRSSRSAFGVGIELDDLDAASARPGMSVKAVARRVLVEDALLLPRSALSWEMEQPRAALAGGGFAEVDIGACNAHFCEILAGLQEGDRLRRVSFRKVVP